MASYSAAVILIKTAPQSATLAGTDPTATVRERVAATPRVCLLTRGHTKNKQRSFAEKHHTVNHRQLSPPPRTLNPHRRRLTSAAWLVRRPDRFAWAQLKWTPGRKHSDFWGLILQRDPSLVSIVVRCYFSLLLLAANVVYLTWSIHL